MSVSSIHAGVPLAQQDLINILIVDDEPRNLTVLETVLEDARYRLVRASSADEALLALMAREYALLILDIRMPGMSGIELAQLIRQRRKTEQVPIIFLTAYYNEDQHVLEGYGSGAVDYLQKPVNPVILRSKVAIFAELHRKNRALEITNRALNTEINERHDAQLQLRSLNESLEQRVEQRTAELLATEQALRTADQQKDNFIAMLAHELRNPLAPMRNAVTLMTRKQITDPQLAWCRDLIDRQLKQMTRLLEDLLDVSRITRSKLLLRREIIELATVIEHAVEIARPALDEGGQTFGMVLPDAPLRLHGDLTRLAQVLSNLLINAARYTAADGRIELRVVGEGAEAVVTVADSGIGIPAEQLDRIFEIFSQIHPAKDHQHGGLGIGLALARGLVEMHGGSIRAQSEGSGKGSQFIVRLPLTDAVPLPPPTDATAATPSAQKYRILVVDDLRDSADSLGLLLRNAGHEVFITYGGVEALQVAEQHQPQVAFVDLGMPDVDGFEVCRRIRASTWGPGTFLVAQTGWGQEFDRRRTRAAGFDQHMVKPIEWQQVDALLRKLPF